ncbi:MAG: hypothetical protein RR320_02170, partial [Oscillospiraceae bacterium]
MRSTATATDRRSPAGRSHSQPRDSAGGGAAGTASATETEFSGAFAAGTVRSGASEPDVGSLAEGASDAIGSAGRSAAGVTTEAAAET